jgi:hypothetical protein
LGSMNEAERLIRGLLELLDVVLHSGQVPRATELLLEDVRMVALAAISAARAPLHAGSFFIASVSRGRGAHGCKSSIKSGVRHA